MQEFKPYVPAEESPPEFTFKAIFLGLILGLIFCVGNAYLGLKIGTTISASIPAAVFSMAILRLLFRNVSILENNIVQTVAAVGEGLAAGIAFTVPALFILGAAPSSGHIFLLALLGGVLGIIFMIPMRRFIIVREHGILPFPEGTACAEILKTSEGSRSSTLLAGIGLLVGSLYKFANSALYLWNEVVNFTFKKFQNALLSIDCTPSLLGVGYIIGPRISAIMFSGGLVAWWVIIPLIKTVGTGGAVIFPGTIPLDQMDSGMIWSTYVRYIGAGAVATGGIFNLIKIGPVIWKTIHVSIRELFEGFGAKEGVLRTDKDISMKWLILGSIATIMTLWLFPGFHLNLLTIILLITLGFFFSCVTSITVGLVGSTSNPVSGMTITTLLITCFIFLALGWTERVYLLAAITMSCVANVAIALAATTSQDLKTGFLLGATPRKLQVAELIGVILPALAIGGTLFLLNKAYGFGSEQLPAPQGTLMAMIAKGVISQDLPVTLVGIGVLLGLVMALVRVPILPFAIGLYLPLSLSSATVIGGALRGIVNHFSKDKLTPERGLLAASGLIAGDACTGVIVALLTVLGVIPAAATGKLPDLLSVAFYLILAAGLGYLAQKKSSLDSAD
ncbi:MAG: oligopeptide transporter, OPT family [Candidatus Algichlamydia australiensis]|nr:oligopeptide transporter, OPT family [Chlamydiales bacterium]